MVELLEELLLGVDLLVVDELAGAVRTAELLLVEVDLVVVEVLVDIDLLVVLLLAGTVVLVGTDEVVDLLVVFVLTLRFAGEEVVVLAGRVTVDEVLAFGSELIVALVVLLTELRLGAVLNSLGEVIEMDCASVAFSLL